MRVHPWMFWLCIIALYYCIELSDCIYPYSLQWVLVVAILSTSLSACVVIILLSCFVLLNCIDLYSWIVLLHCIVYLHIPLRLQWVPVYIFSPHPPVCLCVCISLAGRTLYLRIDIAYYYLWLCILMCTLAHWTLTFIVANLLASTIVEGSRPCPHPYNLF